MSGSFARALKLPLSLSAQLHIVVLGGDDPDSCNSSDGGGAGTGQRQEEPLLP